MKRVLITGITGYIGSNLARELIKDCEVYGLVRAPLNTEYIDDIKEQIRFSFFDGSYESVEVALKEIHPDLVFHLAAYYTGAHGAKETPLLIDANITFGAYLLEAMAACGKIALVYASSVMTIYTGNEYTPLNLYAATKKAFSDLLTYYTDAQLLRSVTLILSDTYGPGDHRPKILNLIRNAAQNNETIALSDGRQDYDLVYIKDVVSAFKSAGMMLLENQWQNETFQVFSPKPLSLRETVERMQKINHLTLKAEWGKKPSPERMIRAVVRLYPSIPGWKPLVSLDEGLRQF